MNTKFQKVILNKSIVNIYSHLKGNFSEDELNNFLENDAEFEIDANDRVHMNFDKLLTDDEIKNIWDKINRGVDENIIEDLCNGRFLNIKFQDDAVLNIKTNLDNDSSATQVFNIKSNEENSCLYFCNEILGNGKQFNFLYNLDIKNNSKVKIIIFTNSKAKGFINFLGNCDSNSQIDVSFIDINKNNLYNNCNMYLEGNSSVANVNICYICNGNYKFDYNITSTMIGKESCSDIKGKGVLLNNAQKIFRGTVDFRKGCLNAKGAENEEVIILSKNIKNQSLPFLLCKEKNVEGRHGFTANSIDEEKMFYLLSRGFNENQAKGIILKGKFLSLLSKIENDEIVEKFMNVLGAL